MLVTDSAGDAAERYEYGDYGAPFYFTGAGSSTPFSAINNTRLFNGREWDDESRFYYYRTRYLEPTMGRFTTRDTIGVWGDANNRGNASEYAGARPWTFVDSFGRACEDTCKSACPTQRVRVIEEQWNGNTGGRRGVWKSVADPTCVARCKAICRSSCGGEKLPCNPGGSIAWDNTFENSSRIMAFQVLVSNVDAACCSEIALVQFVRMRTKLNFSWSSWQIDDGRVFPLDTWSPGRPYFELPKPINAETGLGSVETNDDPESFLWREFEFQVNAICSKGPATGHVFGTFLWSTRRWARGGASPAIGYPSPVPINTPIR